MNNQSFSNEALKQLQAFADKQGDILIESLQNSGYDVVIQDTFASGRYLKVSIRSHRYSESHLTTIFRVSSLYEQPLDPFIYINKTMLNLVKDAF